MRINNTFQIHYFNKAINIKPNFGNDNIFVSYRTTQETVSNNATFVTNKILIEIPIQLKLKILHIRIAN